MIKKSWGYRQSTRISSLILVVPTSMIYQDQIYQGVLGASAPLLKGALLKNKILEKLRKN